MAGSSFGLRWAYTLRDSARRPLRWLLALAGIVLGVAAVAAVLTAIEGTRRGYATLFRAASGHATHELIPRAPFFTPDLAAIRNAPGVLASVGVVQAPSALITPAGPLPLLVLGIDPAAGGVHDFSPPLPHGLTGVRLERRFAARLGVAVLDDIRIATPGGPATVTVTGLHDATGPLAFNGGAAGVVSLDLARDLFRLPSGSYTAVHVVLAPGAALDVPDADLRPVGGKARLAAEYLAGMEQAHLTLCVVAVVAGALVIFNTVLMHLAERRRQLALLRALGASSAQLRGIVLRQALLLGLAGALVGVPLGVVLAAAVLSLNATFLGVITPAWVLAPQALLFAGLLGPVLALAAAYFPASEAASRPPLPDLAGRTRADAPARWPAFAGAALAGFSLVFVIAVWAGRLPGAAARPLLPFAAAPFLVGCAMLLPSALPWLLAPAAWLARGPESRLALRLLAREPRRTALTVGVLFAAVCAAVAFGNSFENNLADIHAWYRASIPDAWIVRPSPADPASVLTTAALPDGLDDDLAALPGVGIASRIRFLPLDLAGVPALLIAREVPPAMPAPFLVHAGNADALRRGEALVGTALAGRLGVGVGDHIDLPTPDGPARVRVGAVVKEYSLGGLAFYLDYAEARRLFRFCSPHAVGLTPTPGREGELRQAVSDIAEGWGLAAESNERFSGMILRVALAARLSVAGLMLLVALVAAVGVANTLAANLIDQTRQMGLLRAVGLPRARLRRLILSQALILGGAGLLAGLPAGVLLAWLMNITTPALLGHFVPFSVSPAQILGCVIATFAVVILAAWGPARRAASLDIAEALRHT